MPLCDPAQDPQPHQVSIRPVPLFRPTLMVCRDLFPLLPSNAGETQVRELGQEFTVASCIGPLMFDKLDLLDLQGGGGVSLRTETLRHLLPLIKLLKRTPLCPVSIAELQEATLLQGAGEETSGGKRLKLRLPHSLPSPRDITSPIFPERALVTGNSMSTY